MANTHLSVSPGKLKDTAGGLTVIHVDEYLGNDVSSSTNGGVNEYEGSHRSWQFSKDLRLCNREEVFWNESFRACFDCHRRLYNYVDLKYHVTYPHQKLACESSLHLLD